jgi:hypothetical protein
MTNAVLELTHNPYWDAVSGRVTKGDMHWEKDALFIGGLGRWEFTADRFERASDYAWTITSPETVAFVVEHIGPSAIDPLAGSGYWAYLLRQVGVNVLASDINPAGAANQWHKGSAWLPMLQMDAVGSVARAAKDRTLLLSWPPYGSSVGADVLKIYQGSRVIYIGEGEGGCCGDDEMFQLLDDHWTEVVDHRPVQWFGMHDWVTVYDRTAVAS